MFIRLAQFEIESGRFDEAVEVFRTHVFPRLEREPGFMRALLCGDQGESAGILFTMWQTEEHATRYFESGDAARLLEPFARLFASPPSFTGYPVLFDREF